LIRLDSSLICPYWLQPPQNSDVNLCGAGVAEGVRPSVKPWKWRLRGGVRQLTSRVLSAFKSPGAGPGFKSRFS